MVIHDQREKERELDRALKAQKNTVMVLCGGPQCEVVHSYTQEPGVLDPWQKCFLIEDLSVLKKDEKDAWFDGDNPERYAVLGGKDLPKQVAVKGSTDDLVLADVEADRIAISTAFGKGDQL